MEEQTTQLMKTKPVDLEKEMKKSFLEYSMSVIVARALPDVRDGLKPVHRRILYTMHENNLTPDKAYRKCADTVGAVLGRYHPHGDEMCIRDSPGPAQRPAQERAADRRPAGGAAGCLG